VNPIFWPQDLLPEDCAAARIMTFGYDSDASKFFDGAVNKNNFYDHANDLLRALLRERLGIAKVSRGEGTAHQTETLMACQQ
jgi:hypothetical protein